jgi:hypothetical protein
MAVLVLAALAIGGCSSPGNQHPTTPSTTATTTTESSNAAPAPTEKSVSPTGGNLFTPPVKATPAPDVPGGAHPGINGVP